MKKKLHSFTIVAVSTTTMTLWPEEEEVQEGSKRLAQCDMYLQLGCSLHWPNYHLPWFFLMWQKSLMPYKNMQVVFCMTQWSFESFHS